MIVFKDRFEAGRHLASRLKNYADKPEVRVLALPRGGVPVAYEVARALNAPLDVFVVRKLGVPGEEELAMGAIASGGIRVLNPEIIHRLRIPQSIIEKVIGNEMDELSRREKEYRGDRPPPDVTGNTIIIIDDGLATGATMRAALLALRSQEPGRLVMAVPAGAQDTCEELRHEADEVVCLATPEPFLSVGQWYVDFPQMSDQEVRGLLELAREDRVVGIA